MSADRWPKPNETESRIPESEPEPECKPEARHNMGLHFKVTLSPVHINGVLWMLLSLLLSSLWLLLLIAVRGEEIKLQSWCRELCTRRPRCVRQL